MKPIHKFNGGRGATLCNECRVIITEGFTEDLFCEAHGGAKPNYILIRERDHLINKANTIKWVEWKDNGTASKAHDEPSVGFSLILDPGYSYRWLTTEVTEIVEKRKDYIKFKTLNSIYELYIKQDESNT